MSNSGSSPAFWSPMAASGGFFYLALFVVSVFLAFPDFPPMVDMPQFAAQAATLKSMLAGDSHWQTFTELNLFTPYWVGYALLLALSSVFPMTVAVKVFLIGVFVTFVLGFSRIRAKLGAPESLDWLLLPAFFGFAYAWGFFTFLAASALVGPWFFLANVAWQEEKASRRKKWIACGVLGLGLLLLFSHMLAFGFFVLASLLYLLASMQKDASRQDIVCLIGVYALLAVVMALLLGKEDALAQFYPAYRRPLSWSEYLGSVTRFPAALFTSFPLDNRYLRFMVQVVLLALCVATPFFMGMRFSRRRASYSLLLAFLLIWFCFPNSMNGIGLLRERFALFFIPAWISCFERPIRPAFGGGRRSVFWLAATVSVMLFAPLMNLYTFRQEAAGFKALVNELPAGQRAFYVRSELSHSEKVLLHLPLWYQAMRKG